MTEPLREEPLNLPVVHPGGEVEADVVDGVIVDEPPAPQRPVIVLQAVKVVNVINVVVQHPVPREAARHAVGHPAAGVVIAWRRWRRGRSLAIEMGQQAKLQGDHDKALLWAQQAEAERQNRHGRMTGTAETAAMLVKLVPVALAVGVLLMAVLNVFLFIATHRPRDLAWSFLLVAHLVQLGVEVFSVLLWVLVFGVPAALYVLFYAYGRRGGELAPGWVRTSADDDADIVIDERAVTQALAALRIPQVRDYLKAGNPLQFLVPCRQEGRGTGFEVRTPGIAAEQVVRRRPHVAAGLYRAPKETFLSVGADASILKGWIADKGALDEGAGDYPLLASGFTDVFKGLPFGKTLRGDPVKIPVIGRNSMVGGAPEQGKSNSARVVACGYTLDVITEMRIYVPDANFDFDAFEPRCSRYLVGAEDEVIERMLEEQELLKEELQRRGQLLRDYEVQEVTYEIAHAGVGLHPVYNLIEEAHVCIQHRKFGKAFGQLLGENVKLCRKRGEHIEVSTQAPVRGSMPRDVTTNCTVGIAHAVQDHYANDALLGPGAHAAGHRATELMLGTDRGIALCKGFASEARSEIVQAYPMPTERVPPIVKRALAELARQGKPVPGTERGPAAIVSRDLLADLATVLRSPDRILVRDVVGLLRELAPSWSRYRQMTATSLRGDLLELGVRTVNTSGTHFLDPADLRAAVARREVCE